MIYDSVFQKVLASIFSLTLLSVEKLFIASTKFLHIKLTVIVVKSLDVSFQLLFGQGSEV